MIKTNLFGKKLQEEVFFLWKGYKAPLEKHIFVHYLDLYLKIVTTHYSVHHGSHHAPQQNGELQVCNIGANRHSPSYNDRMVAIAFSCDWLFFHAVSAMECMAKKASAPTSDLKVPDIFCLTFNYLIPLSLLLLSEGISESSRKLKM